MSLALLAATADLEFPSTAEQNQPTAQGSNSKALSLPSARSGCGSPLKEVKAKSLSLSVKQNTEEES